MKNVIGFGRVYSLACIAEMLAIWLWRDFHPGAAGIPGFLFSFTWIPAWGILIAPAFLVMEIVLCSAGRWPWRALLLSLPIYLPAIWFCALGYSQVPARPW